MAKSVEDTEVDEHPAGGDEVFDDLRIRRAG